VLKSNRLVIQEIDEALALQVSETVDDRDDITEYLAALPEKAVQDSLLDMQSVLDFVQSLSSIRNSNDIKRYGAWNQAGELIAYVGLICWNTGTPELQITVAKAYQQLGYGKEFLHALLPWLFQRFDVKYFVYRVRNNNIPSEKIVQSLGGIRQEPKSALENLILQTYRIYSR